MITMHMTAQLFPNQDMEEGLYLHVGLGANKGSSYLSFIIFTELVSETPR